MSLANVLLPQPDFADNSGDFAAGNHQGKVFQQVYSARMVEGDIDTDNIAIVGNINPGFVRIGWGFGRGVDDIA